MWATTGAGRTPHALYITSRYLSGPLSRRRDQWGFVGGTCLRPSPRRPEECWIANERTLTGRLGARCGIQGAPESDDSPSISDISSSSSKAGLKTKTTCEASWIARRRWHGSGASPKKTTSTSFPNFPRQTTLRTREGNVRVASVEITLISHSLTSWPSGSLEWGSIIWQCFGIVLG